MLQLLNRCLYLSVGLLGILGIAALLAIVDTTAGFLAGVLGGVAFWAWAYLRLAILPTTRARKTVEHHTQSVSWYTGPPTRVLSYRSPFIPPLPVTSKPEIKQASTEAGKSARKPSAEEREDTRKNAPSIPASSLADTRVVVPLKPQYMALPLHLVESPFLWPTAEEEHLQTTAQHIAIDPAVDADINEPTEFPSQEAPNFPDDPSTTALP